MSLSGGENKTVAMAIALSFDTFNYKSNYVKFTIL